MERKVVNLINWKVRVKQKMFWLALIPAILILIQTVAALFGIEIDISGVSARLIDIVNAVFAVLVILGIVTDPTTKGFGDSERALTYTEPN